MSNLSNVSSKYNPRNQCSGVRLKLSGSYSNSMCNSNLGVMNNGFNVPPPPVPRNANIRNNFISSSNSGLGNERINLPPPSVPWNPSTDSNLSFNNSRNSVLRPPIPPRTFDVRGNFISSSNSGLVNERFNVGLPLPSVPWDTASNRNFSINSNHSGLLNHRLDVPPPSAPCPTGGNSNFGLNNNVGAISSRFNVPPPGGTGASQLSSSALLNRSSGFPKDEVVKKPKIGNGYQQDHHEKSNKCDQPRCLQSGTVEEPNRFPYQSVNRSENIKVSSVTKKDGTGWVDSQSSVQGPPGFSANKGDHSVNLGNLIVVNSNVQYPNYPGLCLSNTAQTGNTQPLNTPPHQFAPVPGNEGYNQHIAHMNTTNNMVVPTNRIPPLTGFGQQAPFQSNFNSSGHHGNLVNSAAHSEHFQYKNNSAGYNMCNTGMPSQPHFMNYQQNISVHTFQHVEVTPDKNIPFGVRSTVTCNETYYSNSRVRNEHGPPHNSQQYLNNQLDINGYNNVQERCITKEKFGCQITSKKKDSIEELCDNLSDYSSKRKSDRRWSPKTRRSRSRSPLKNKSRYREEDRRSMGKSRSEKTPPKRLKHEKYQRRSVTPPRSSKGHSEDETSRSKYDRSKRSYGHSSSRGSSVRRRTRSRSPVSTRQRSEREILLDKWRSSDETKVDETNVWTRSAPAELYYSLKDGNSRVMEATGKLKDLCSEFENKLVQRAERVRAELPKYEPPPRKKRLRVAKHKSKTCSSSSSSSESESEQEDCTMEELERKRKHPHRLHQELWYNDVGEMNDGPLCRCSARARRSGIRHNIYAGEQSLQHCDLLTNNSDKLYHYRITISPPTNFLVKTPTIICHDEHEYIFEGFSMFSHGPLGRLPVCKVIRFNIEYTILYIEEKLPENFTIKELDLFYNYLFQEILELVDLDLKAAGDTTGCSLFHFMPRFVRELPDNGKEILSMNKVLEYLLKSCELLIPEDKLDYILQLPQYKWQDMVDEVKGMVVTYPGKKPCSLRVDQLDRDQEHDKENKYPEIVHFGIRPPQLSYAGNPEYQKAWREYVKFRHLLANMPKPSSEDKRKLAVKENRLQEMRTQTKMKRDVTVTVSSKNFYKTGVMCDIVQHAMLVPVLVTHLRFHRSLDVLEEKIDYKFTNRYLLQLALTHPSYRENFGTNPDHARNSLTNCGIRQPEYGDRRIHYMNTRKRGINTLINIMSRFGKKTETESNITHNERLEFLGDAVVEFVTSIHLFHIFPDLEEGGLATYRAAIVQNQHLAVLAKTLGLEDFMLYAHGSDLCHDLELRHAMANCFEALMGALFLDGGIEVADKVFGETLFKNEPHLLDIWVNYPPHPLQEQEPLGDRRWIPSFPLLQNLTKFEESIGVKFRHIRLLARAFTDRSIGYTNLTLGSNQRLEFLGDTVLQLIASEYLYKFFPEHHEGHLSLLRSSLVNNRTQSVVCNDLGMTAYALYSVPKSDLKTKDRADLLEAFLGALYVDKGLEYCEVFCSVCFFPRLHDFIMHQDWNDPKSKLQQCCLTLRTMEGGEPEIPVYKVIECMGPTNTRIYTVAVYFKGERLAQASGHSIQQAEMNAAKKALDLSKGLFPQLDHQKRVISKSMRKQQRSPDNSHNFGRREADLYKNKPNHTYKKYDRHSRSSRKRRSRSRSCSRGRSRSRSKRNFRRSKSRSPARHSSTRSHTPTDNRSDSRSRSPSSHASTHVSRSPTRHGASRRSYSPTRHSSSCRSSKSSDIQPRLKKREIPKQYQISSESSNREKLLLDKRRSKSRSPCQNSPRNSSSKTYVEDKRVNEPGADGNGCEFSRAKNSSCDKSEAMFLCNQNISSCD